MEWHKAELTVFDREDGYTVRFERYISGYDGEPCMGVALFYMGREVMHSGHTGYEPTQEAAEEIVATYEKLVEVV